MEVDYKSRKIEINDPLNNKIIRSPAASVKVEFDELKKRELARPLLARVEC